jgi:hypothetical protein
MNPNPAAAVVERKRRRDFLEESLEVGLAEEEGDETTGSFMASFLRGRGGE